MKKLFIMTIFLTSATWCHAAKYQEFYMDAANGLNNNAGDNKTRVQDVGGSWDSVTSSYTASAGTPFSSVSTGDYVAVYLTGKSSTSFIAAVSTIGAGGSFLIVYSTMSGGKVPTTGSGYSATTGGVWKGPTAGATDTSFVPFNLVNSSMTDFSGDLIRVNMKNNALYFSTVSVTHTFNGIMFEGYANNPGDGGKITWSNSANVINFNPAGGGNVFKNIIFTSTSSAGAAQEILTSGKGNVFENDVFTAGRGFCLDITGTTILINDEISNCNRSNTAATGGLSPRALTVAYGLNIHDNLGTNSSGIVDGIGPFVGINTISAGNGQYGYVSTAGNSTQAVLIGLDLSNNISDGIHSNGTSANSVNFFYVMNTNIGNNGGYGFNPSASIIPSVASYYFNKTGYFNNTSGINNPATPVMFVSSFSYTRNPYQNMTNGNYNMIDAAGIGTGIGTFTTTLSSSTLIGYPNVGAIQPKRFPGGTLTVSN